MKFDEMLKRAREIREKYAALEKKKYGRSWTNAEIALGFVGDVGKLAKLVLAKEKIREIPDADEKIEHELSDCLWSVLVLADIYKVDLGGGVFMENMQKLEQRIKEEENDK